LGVENVDVSGLVKRHLDYPAKMPRIMKHIGIESDGGELARGGGADETTDVLGEGGEL
jgi:hypothetical protein